MPKYIVFFLNRGGKAVSIRIFCVNLMPSFANLMPSFWCSYILLLATSLLLRKFFFGHP